MALAILRAFSFSATTPTMCPLVSSNGPPLLPGWTGALICMKRLSLRMPLSELTIPVVTVRSDVNNPWNGKPMAIMRISRMDTAVANYCYRRELSLGLKQSEVILFIGRH